MTKPLYSRWMLLWWIRRLNKTAARLDRASRKLHRHAHGLVNRAVDDFNRGKS